MQQQMRKLLFHSRRRELITSILLVVLLFRAYVPLGFMPASGTPFLLEICPVGLPSGMLPHHLHHHSVVHDHFENCPFGSAPAAGPISHLIGFESAAQIGSLSVIARESFRFGAPLRRAHQSRAPPSLA
jgi:hypothetical protein